MSVRFAAGGVEGFAGCKPAMSQEQLFLKALRSATTFTLQDGRLELRRGDGALALSARVGE